MTAMIPRLENAALLVVEIHPVLQGFLAHGLVRGNEQRKFAFHSNSGSNAVFQDQLGDTRGICLSQYLGQRYVLGPARRLLRAFGKELLTDTTDSAKCLVVQQAGNKSEQSDEARGERRDAGLRGAHVAREQQAGASDQVDSEGRQRTEERTDDDLSPCRIGLLRPPTHLR